MQGTRCGADPAVCRAYIRTEALSDPEVTTELSRPRTSWRAPFTPPVVLAQHLTAGRSCGTRARRTRAKLFAVPRMSARISKSGTGPDDLQCRWNVTQALTCILQATILDSLRKSRPRSSAAVGTGARGFTYTVVTGVGGHGGGSRSPGGVLERRRLPCAPALFHPGALGLLAPSRLVLKRRRNRDTRAFRMSRSILPAGGCTNYPFATQVLLHPCSV